jgi:hypothetical protein
MTTSQQTHWYDLLVKPFQSKDKKNSFKKTSNASSGTLPAIEEWGHAEELAA